MPRILVAGGLREMGAWEPFARAMGEELAKAGVSLSLLLPSTFGAALAAGHKGEPRLRAEDAADAGVLAPKLRPLLPAEVGGDAADQAAREADLVLLAGHGKHLRHLATAALARKIPLLAVPIPGSTSEEVWEENLRHLPDVAVEATTRTSILGLRSLNPRSRMDAAKLAATAAKLAAASQLPGSGHVLVVGRSDPVPGEDEPATILRRVLRAARPGVAVEEAPRGWLRSPGRAFADAVKGADLVVLDGVASYGAVYALGLARGAGKPAIALARRSAAPPLDAGALDALLFDADDDLAARLEEKLGRIRPSPSAPKKGRRRSAGRGRARGRRPAGEGRGEPPSGDAGNPSGS